MEYMRRPNWKTVSTLITLIVIAGCQSSTIAAPSNATVSAKDAKRVDTGFSTSQGRACDPETETDCRPDATTAP
jgi:hypothetical protein